VKFKISKLKMKMLFGHRIIFSFTIMAVLSVLVGYFAFVTTKSVQRVSYAIMKENVASLKAAEELEIALLSQKGLVGSYFLDGNDLWLKTIEDKKRDFDIWFNKAREVALTDNEKVILLDISRIYSMYDKQRNHAIRLYRSGNLSEAKSVLLKDMKASIDRLYQRCEDLILANETLIAQAEQASRGNVARMTAIIWLTVIVTLFLGGLSGFFVSRKFNEQLLRAAKLASLGQVAANIAHEIRNPLTSIKMRLYTLSEELKNRPSAKDDVDIIQEEISRMERTVQNFLDFSRLPEPTLQKCDISRILDGTINLVSVKAQSQGITIRKNIDAVFPETVADKEQMRQVFLNVILNAMESMPDGGALEAGARCIEDKKGVSAIEIKIKDFGCGIPFEMIKKVSEPFFTTKTEGTGLGLFIASRILERHKGSIVISSKQGKGTTVSIELPVV